MASQPHEVSPKISFLEIRSSGHGLFGPTSQDLVDLGQVRGSVSRR